ncbi:MAG: hypothetical protein ACUVS7_18770, partial [Bryobacteraceae bacterium]
MVFRRRCRRWILPLQRKIDPLVHGEHIAAIQDLDNLRPRRVIPWQLLLEPTAAFRNLLPFPLPDLG